MQTRRQTDRTATGTSDHSTGWSRLSCYGWFAEIELDFNPNPILEAAFFYKFQFLLLGQTKVIHFALLMRLTDRLKLNLSDGSDTYSDQSMIERSEGAGIPSPACVYYSTFIIMI